MSKGIKHKTVGTEMTQYEWEALDSHEFAAGTSFPGTPTEKDLFYRTDEHKWYVYNGTVWKPLTDLEKVDSLPTVVIGKMVYLTTDGKVYVAKAI